MKVTLDIPDSAIVLTYQYVFETDQAGHLSILQDVLDSRALTRMRGGQEDAE